MVDWMDTMCHHLSGCFWCNPGKNYQLIQNTTALYWCISVLAWLSSVFILLGIFPIVLRTLFNFFDNSKNNLWNFHLNRWVVFESIGNKHIKESFYKLIFILIVLRYNSDGNINISAIVTLILYLSRPFSTLCSRFLFSGYFHFTFVENNNLWSETAALPIMHEGSGQRQNVIF